MNWNYIQTLQEWENAKQQSHDKLVLVFKHSTTCSISISALARLERNWKDDKVKDKIIPYLLDLLAHRDISNQIAKDTSVIHQSPQAIMLDKEKVIYQNSHYGIDFEDMVEEL